MWFDPGALVKNKTEPFAIPAIPAIPDEENSTTVSENRKVAKIAEPLEYENTVIEVKPTLIKCHDCLHFKCFNQHGRGAGIALLAAITAYGAKHYTNARSLTQPLSGFMKPIPLHREP